MGEGIRIGGGKSSGAYVWKKYNAVPASCKVTFRLIQESPAQLQVVLTGEESIYDPSYLIGKTFTLYNPTHWDHVFTINSLTSATFTNTALGKKTVSLTYNESTKVLQINDFTATSIKKNINLTIDDLIKTFLKFVVDNNPSRYPDGGYKNGYYYEIYGLPIKMVTWANGTDEEIIAMVEAADQGIINLSDYWAVGDTRTVQLSAMSATGVGESHAAQAVDLVLMHAGGYELNEAVASGRTECSFVVGQKDSLATAGYMNPSKINSGSWNGSARRTWCNEVYKNALPNTLLPIFKQFKTITAQTYNGSTNQESVDYFALPAGKEVVGGSVTSAGSGTGYSNLTEYNALFQFDYYKTASNRVKKLGKTGSAGGWWERSPYYDNSTNFCYISSNGATGASNANNTFGLTPFGCI